MARHEQVVVGQLTTREYVAQNGLAALVRALAVTTFQSFLGQFGWMGVVLHPRIYLAWGVLLTVVGGGVLAVAGQTWRSRQSASPLEQRAALMLVLCRCARWVATSVQYPVRAAPGALPVPGDHPARSCLHGQPHGAAPREAALRAGRSGAAGAGAGRTGHCRRGISEFVLAATAAATVAILCGSPARAPRARHRPGAGVPRDGRAGRLQSIRVHRPATCPLNALLSGHADQSRRYQMNGTSRFVRCSYATYSSPTRSPSSVPRAGCAWPSAGS